MSEIIEHSHHRSACLHTTSTRCQNRSSPILRSHLEGYSELQRYIFHNRNANFSPFFDFFFDKKRFCNFKDRRRLGIAKFENSVFICLCSRLSLSLHKIGCISAENSNKFGFLPSTFAIFVSIFGFRRTNKRLCLK